LAKKSFSFDFIRVKRQKIVKALSNQGSFRWVARKISPVGAERIRVLKLEGVHLVREPKRFYPHREMACHLLGFAGLDSTGLEGLELKYDEYLKSVPKEVVWGRDARGHKIYLDDESGGTVAGRSCSLFLTIDSKIQYIVESQLRSAVERTLGRVDYKKEQDFYHLISRNLTPHYHFSSAWCFFQKGRYN